MNRRAFSKIALSAIPLMSFRKKGWSVQLVRHATLVIRINDVKFLIDPMLSPKDAMDPVANAGNNIRIPMVALPFPVEQLVNDVDAVFVTHTHRDHWDVAAQQMIDKSKPIFTQLADFDKIKSQGFNNVTAVIDKIEFKGVTVHRVSGNHGTGEMGQKMGPVSGFIFDFKGDRLFVFGDTIWCPPIEQAMLFFQPQVIVVNAGGAQFVTSDPITMDERDIKLISSVFDTMPIVAVHMDTVNHCKVTRKVLKRFLSENKIENVRIPADGETLAF